MIEIDNQNYYTASEVAKILAVRNDKGKILGRNLFIAWLKTNGVLMEDGFPYQYYINMDMIRLHAVQRNCKTYYCTVFSQRGINYLKHKYKKM